MNVQAQSSFADLTTPLLPPEISGSFEALSEGRCTLSELTRSVLEVCRRDSNATEGVLLLLEDCASSGEFDRFDFGPLRRALEYHQKLPDATPEIDADPLQDSNAAPASLSNSDGLTRDSGPAMLALDSSPPISNIEIDESSTDGSVERNDHSSDNPLVATVTEPPVLRDRYVLEMEIGRGGVGTVYRALDLNRAGLPCEHQHVAVKVLRGDVSERPDAVRALRREYHQAQSLSHPGIVNVFDFDRDGSTYFVTMELLDGESLGALMRRPLPNKLPLQSALRILRELGDAVAYAHHRGVLHLDLKPDNVMIDAQGHVRVLDFGVAQTTHVAEPWISEVLSAPPAAATVAYASCERLLLEPPDVRDDIFSFSCIAYELLAGEHPFGRLSALKARNDGRQVRRIRRLSRRQWVALQSGLAWAREDRPASMRELLQGLELQANAPPPAAARRVAWHLAAALGLLAIGTAAILSWHRGPAPGWEGVDERASRATTAPPQGGPETAAPATLEPSEIESARVVAEPPPRPVDAPAETGQLDATPTPRSPEPQEVPAASQALSEPRSTAEPLDVLGFSRHSFSVSEADSVAHVNVRRLGGAAGDISFQWYTVDESASAGRDYVFGFGEVVMAPGQTTATLEVPIVADSTREDPELLQVVMGSSHGADVGPAGRASIIIVDDD